jgi:hypothetical protein
MTQAMSAVSLRATGSEWHPDTAHAVWVLWRYGGFWRMIETAADAQVELDEVDRLANSLKIWVAPEPRDADLLDVDMSRAPELRPVPLHEWELERVATAFHDVVSDGSYLHIRITPPPGAKAVTTLCRQVAPTTPLEPISHPYRERLVMCASCAGPLMTAYQRDTDWGAGEVPR